jgi:hypothetical protein
VQGTLSDGTPIAVLLNDLTAVTQGSALLLQALPEHIHRFDALGQTLKQKEFI